MEQPTSLDLFCGAGGITEGFRLAGFRCLYANDFDADAVATFKANHPGAEAVCASVQDLDPSAIRKGLSLARGELNCLVGGPPCTGFSINAPERFLEDPRNQLFRHYLRFVEEFQPETLLLENVPGMLSLSQGHVFEQIVKELQALGYDVASKILFAAHYGVPQERWRLIVLGSRIGPPPAHPLPTHGATGVANFTGGRKMTYRLTPEDCARLKPKVTIYDALGDLPALAAGEGSEEMPYTLEPHSEYARWIRQDSTCVSSHIAAKLSPVNLDRLKHIKPGGSWRDIPRELLPEGMKRARSSDHTRRYGRLTREGLAGTVMTKMDPHWGAAFHYEQDRTLTAREAARIQSFPDRYQFLGSTVAQYKQIGNAVPVLMARAIAEELLAAIRHETADLALCL